MLFLILIPYNNTTLHIPARPSHTAVYSHHSTSTLKYIHTLQYIYTLQYIHMLQKVHKLQHIHTAVHLPTAVHSHTLQYIYTQYIHTLQCIHTHTHINIELSKECIPFQNQIKLTHNLSSNTAEEGRKAEKSKIHVLTSKM